MEKIPRSNDKTHTCSDDTSCVEGNIFVHVFISVPESSACYAEGYISTVSFFSSQEMLLVVLLDVLANPAPAPYSQAFSSASSNFSSNLEYIEGTVGLLRCAGR